MPRTPRIHRTRPNWTLPKDMINLVALVAAANQKRPEQLVEEILHVNLKRATEALKNAE